MTAIAEKCAHAHTHTMPNQIICGALSVSPFFLLLFLLSSLCFLLTQLNPRTTPPSLPPSASLSSAFLSHSNHLFCFIVVIFFLSTFLGGGSGGLNSGLHELAPAGVHGNSPSPSPTALSTLLKAFPGPGPTPPPSPLSVKILLKVQGAVTSEGFALKTCGEFRRVFSFDLAGN